MFRTRAWVAVVEVLQSDGRGILGAMGDPQPVPGGAGHVHEPGHDNAHRPGALARLRHLVRPHSHEAADKGGCCAGGQHSRPAGAVDLLAVLGGTALVQAAIVAVSGSVALLDDTLHNAADALTAVPLALHRQRQAVPARRRSAREPELAGQTVVVIGGGAGIGLETARRARAEGADVIITGRNPDRLKQAALDVGAQRTAAFDASDAAALQRFFQDLPAPIDHVLITAGGPSYGPLLEMDAGQVRHAISDHMVQALEVARNAAGKMRPGGTVLLMGGTGGRRVGHGLGIASAATAALPPFTAALALELAPVRVNLIAAGFVDTPLSASLLGDRLEERRNELRATLPIGRVVGPADVAALAVHIMSNTALTSATYDIDGGQQFVSS